MPQKRRMNPSLCHCMRRFVLLLVLDPSKYWCYELCWFTILGYCFQLRQSLFHGENNYHDAFYNHENNEDDDYDNGNHDFEAPDFDMPETTERNEDEHLNKEKVSCHLEKVNESISLQETYFETELLKYTYLCSMAMTAFHLPMKVMKIHILIRLLKIFADPIW